jgi:DMSO/TMAO reductase YedYZ heme-binding membrane subunit
LRSPSPSSIPWRCSSTDPQNSVSPISSTPCTPRSNLENTIGAIALYSVALIVVTSYFRIQIGRRTWKAFHFTVYLGAPALFWHALLTDPDLKSAPIDWFDGGKLFVEACALVILVSSLLRWQHSRKKIRHLSHQKP